MHPPAHSPALVGVSPGRATLLWGEVGELYAAVEAEHPEQAMMAALARVVPCYSAVLNAIALRPNRLVSWSSLRPERRDASAEPAVVAHLHRHPTLGRLVGEPSHGALRLCDVATGAELRRNPFVEGYYRPNGLLTQITFSAGRAETVERGAVWVVGLNRLERAEFTAEDLACGDALRPHLERALRLLEARRRREAVLVARDGAAAAADCGSLAFDPAGFIVGASAHARRILAEWFGAAETARRLPENLWGRLVSARPATGAGWRTAVYYDRPDGARLEVCCRSEAGTELPLGLWFREIRPAGDVRIGAALGLTPRQATVARWVAEGKTNTEIALLAGCSPRTIEKHIEQILERLGVANRVGIAGAVRGLGA